VGGVVAGILAEDNLPVEGSPAVAAHYNRLDMTAGVAAMQTGSASNSYFPSNRDLPAGTVLPVGVL